MNIYLVVEDGDTFCIQADTMNEAVKFCEEVHLEECSKNYLEIGIGFDAGNEKRYYQEQILQSCSLIGELKN